MFSVQSQLKIIIDSSVIGSLWVVRAISQALKEETGHFVLVHSLRLRSDTYLVLRMLLSGWYKPGVDGSLRIFGGPHTLRPLAGHDSPCTQGDFLSAVAFVVFVVSGIGGRHRAQDQMTSKAPRSISGWDSPWRKWTRMRIYS